LIVQLRMEHEDLQQNASTKITLKWYSKMLTRYTTMTTPTNDRIQCVSKPFVMGQRDTEIVWRRLRLLLMMDAITLTMNIVVTIVNMIIPKASVERT